MDGTTFIFVMVLALGNLVWCIANAGLKDKLSDAKRTITFLRTENEKLANERNEAKEHLDMHHNLMVKEAMANIDVPAMLESILGIKPNAPEASPARSSKKKPVTVKKAPHSRSEARRIAIQTGAKPVEKKA